MVPDAWDLSDFHPTEGEDNVTFTQYAAVLLETQGIHRGPFGWLDNHLPPSLLLSAGRLPARVHNGYKCLTALKWFHQAGSIEITLAWLSTIGMSRKCFRRVASRSWFQSTAQLTPINLNWGNLLAYYWAGWPICKLALMEWRSCYKTCYMQDGNHRKSHRNGRSSE